LHVFIGTQCSAECEISESACTRYMPGCFSVLQLHLAAMSSLKGEIIELSGHLQRVNAEKDVLDKQFAKLHVQCFVFVHQFVTLLLLQDSRSTSSFSCCDSHR